MTINLKWHKRFLELAKHISQWSKDPSTKVGAVIVNGLGQVVGMGYNGFARGVIDSAERLNDRPMKYKLVVHAEQNAIIQAGHAARHGTIYVWPSFGYPNICVDCAKFAIQAGIKDGWGYAVEGDNPKFASWQESLKLANEMFIEAGVRWYQTKE
jgi:dCMP deaminase